MTITPARAAAPLPPQRDIEVSALRQTAQMLESHFIAEVLKAAGLHENDSAFGGGAGEEQFSSFLRQAQADQIAKAGGLGLAEAFFRSMVGHDPD